MARDNVVAFQERRSHGIQQCERKRRMGRRSDKIRFEQLPRIEAA